MLPKPWGMAHGWALISKRLAVQISIYHPIGTVLHESVGVRMRKAEKERERVREREREREGGGEKKRGWATEDDKNRIKESWGWGVGWSNWFSTLVRVITPRQWDNIKCHHLEESSEELSASARTESHSGCQHWFPLAFINAFHRALFI